MNVVAKRAYQEFCRQKGRQSDERFFDAWYKACLKARWTCFSDVLADFPSTDSPGNDRLIFDIRGNSYRIIVSVLYAGIHGNGGLWIKWVGTHSEYDRIDPLKV